jgi:hypothetical protein
MLLSLFPSQFTSLQKSDLSALSLARWVLLNQPSPKKNIIASITIMNQLESIMCWPYFPIRLWVFENKRLTLFTLPLLSTELLSTNQTQSTIHLKVWNTFHKALKPGVHPLLCTEFIDLDISYTLLNPPCSALKGLSTFSGTSDQGGR